MKFCFTVMFAFSNLIFCGVTQAHEGEHGPSSIQAPQGGVMRSLDSFHLELVQEKDNIKIYLYSKDLKPAPVKDVSLSAMINLPKEKPAPFLLNDKGNYWEGTYSGKETHRYTIQVELKQGANKHKASYTIERKK